MFSKEPGPFGKGYAIQSVLGAALRSWKDLYDASKRPKLHPIFILMPGGSNDCDMIVFAFQLDGHGKVIILPEDVQPIHSQSRKPSN